VNVVINSKLQNKLLSRCPTFERTCFGVVLSPAVVAGVVFSGSDSDNVYALSSAGFFSPIPTPSSSSEELKCLQAVQGRKVLAVE